MKKINYSIIKILLLIIIGISAIIIPIKYVSFFHIVIYLCLLIYGILQIIVSIKRNNFSYFNLIYSLLCLALIVIITISPSLYASLWPIVIGIYILIVGIARLMTIFIYKSLPESKFNILLNSIIHLIFSIILITRPSNNIRSCTFILGIYLILLGLSYIPKGSRQNDNIKIVEIPMILQTLRPYYDFLKVDFDHYENVNGDIDVDIEILIHIRRNKKGIFGHADLVFNNIVYSYGNYDTSTYKLKDGIGEGVLLLANKEEYINFCKSYGKRLFSFGIKLNSKDKEKIRKKLDNIMSKTYIFNKNKIVKNSYIDKLNKVVHTTFYKFKEGYYRNYFFLNYNCVKFIEEIISNEKVNFTSIKTPGTLYTSLEEKYEKENNNNIRKIIY